MMTIKLEVEKALQKLDDLYQEVNHERKQKEEYSTLTGKLQELNKVLKDEHAKQKVMLDSVVNECNSLEKQQKHCTTELEVCKKENASKNEEIAHLKELTLDMHAQEAIDSANRRLTVVLNALRAIRQLLWEPKIVAQTLELVQENIRVAMIKYAINIFALDGSACKRLKVYCKPTTLDFIAFSAFTQ